MGKLALLLFESEAVYFILLHFPKKVLYYSLTVYSCAILSQENPPQISRIASISYGFWQASSWLQGAVQKGQR